MKRPEFNLRGYRWSEFDQEVVAFLRALRPTENAPHPLLRHGGQIDIDANHERMARAIVAANVSSPARFYVALILEAVLNEAATQAVAPEANRYVDSVRPYLKFLDGPIGPDGAMHHIRAFFGRRGPGASSLKSAAAQLASEWASRNLLVFGPRLVGQTLRRLAHAAMDSNPIRDGFRKAFEDFERAIEDDDPG